MRSKDVYINDQHLLGTEQRERLKTEWSAPIATERFIRPEPPPEPAPPEWVDHCQPCRKLSRERCQTAFRRVHVSYLIRGGTRVMWDLVPNFRDPGPWIFQLQVGHTGDPRADDWENVGPPLTNHFFAIDPEQRVFGKSQWSHYRVKLRTPVDDYCSLPERLMGVLSARDWRIAREIVRKERLRNRLAACEGYLLKRRFTGDLCTLCTDTMTDEVRVPHCPQCFGTGYQCGYYYPMDCIWADLSPQANYTDIDPQGMRGTIQETKIQTRMTMIPLIESMDVWVDGDGDDRFYIHNVQHVAELKCVPLVASVELRPAPYSDVVYDVPIPQQHRSSYAIH